MSKQHKIVVKEKKGESSAPAVGGREVTDLKIAYIGGGSRGWAHALMKDLAVCPHFSGEVRLFDIDYPAAEFNARYGNWVQTHPKAVSDWKWRAVKTRAAALKGADFVFASIMPGPMEYMKFDLQLPEKYGIFQPVGDTVGPGGQIRCLRAIQDYRVIGEAVGEYAPKAWVLNFTNPMTVCTRALYEAFGAIKAYGCCHEVFGTQHTLGNLYAAKIGRPNPSREEIDVNVLGINHFTWIDKATWAGADLLANLREHIARPGVLRNYTKREVLAKKSWFITHRQVSWELLRRFGVVGAAGDRHLSEFLPWFLTSRDSCYRWGFLLTPYSHRIQRWRNIPKIYARQLRSGQLPDMSRSGEEYVNQMLAIVGRAAFRTNVNMPNRGQMGKTPLGAVVETNALFSRDSVQPVVSGALPDNVNTWVQRHVSNQETLIRAGFTGDKDLAFQAFLNDPLVRIGVDKAWKLFNEMLGKTNYKFR